MKHFTACMKYDEEKKCADHVIASNFAALFTFDRWSTPLILFFITSSMDTPLKILFPSSTNAVGISIFLFYFFSFHFRHAV